MKIAVNTRLLLKDKLEGIGWFTYETLQRMVRSHPEHEFIFLFDRPYDESFIFGPNVTPVVAGPPARHPLLFFWWFEITVPRLLQRYNPHVFLSPDGYLSLRASTPSVAVMHDLNFEHYPRDLPFLVRHYYRTMFPRFACKASRIVTVSNYSAADITSRYGVEKERVDVAYNGASPFFTPSSESEQQEARTRLTGGHPYLLYVGALHPRKNIVNMLSAFDHYKRRFPDDPLKLVIVGEKMWKSRAMEEAYGAMDSKDHVIFTGRMDRQRLKAAYGAAQALLYVSYFEGFGIPVVEAFRCHTPVIGSNVTSIPEVAGDGALLVDPFDIEAISNAIARIRKDPEMRNKLARAGAQRATLFSWDNTAETLWRSLMKVAERE